MYNSIIVANNILQLSFVEKIPITPLKLQKILYFCNRDFLKSTNEPLINEKFSVWELGPVAESVYQVYKKYGGDYIDNYGIDEPEITEKKVVVEIIKTVWDKCKNITARGLVDLTHQEGSGWKMAKDNGDYIIKDEFVKRDNIIIKVGE